VDVFESDRAGGRRRLHAVARSDKASIQVDNIDASIERQELYYNSVGRDFHPDTFFEVLGYPLTEWLELELETNRADTDRSVEIDSDGILHLWVRAHVVTPRGKEYDVETQIWFDTQKELRPVFYERKFKYPDGSWFARQVKLQWARFDSTWYVSAFEYSELPSNHGHVVGTIKNFSTNVEVADEEFTLNGMDVPDGLLVSDSIAGVSYRYGVPLRAVEDLQKSLDDADFVQKIREQQPVDQKQSLPSVEESAQPTDVEKTHSHTLQPGVITSTVIVALALFGVVAFLAYRHATIRARS